MPTHFIKYPSVWKWPDAAKKGGGDNKNYRIY